MPSLQECYLGPPLTYGVCLHFALKNRVKFKVPSFNHFAYFTCCFGFPFFNQKELIIEIIAWRHVCNGLLAWIQKKHALWIMSHEIDIQRSLYDEQAPCIHHEALSCAQKQQNSQDGL